MKLPAIISDNMVLQKNEPIKIWGWDEPGNKITVTLLQKPVVTETDKHGKWMVTLPPMNNAGSCDMNVSGSSTATIRNIIFGDVWLASGQSNMEMPVKLSMNGEEEIRNANYPDIRLFHVALNSEIGVIKDVIGHWEICSKENISDFSAVAYFFGRSIHLNSGIPIGLIMSAWGGTTAEAWTSRVELISEPLFRRLVEYYEECLGLSQKEIKEKQRKTTIEWKIRNHINDPCVTGNSHKWVNSNFDDGDWKIMEIPNFWQAKGLKGNGVVCFRRVIDIPDTWHEKDCTLSLGPCDKSDITWFNNIKIGSLSIDENENAWNIPRVYKISGKLMKAGKNVLAVRIYSHIFGGGFAGKKEDMKITLDGDDREVIYIGGEWKYNVEHDFGLVSSEEMPQNPFFEPGNSNTPYILFDNMIAPLIPFPLKGVIWYQGEANAVRSSQYQMLFQMLINDWRKQWHNNHLHFYFVQLANFGENSQKSPWAEIREAQRKALKLPNTGMAVTIDIGESGNKHPVNKQDVGGRLALIALKKIYGENIEYSGPVYEKLEFKSNGDIQIYFSHVQGLCTSESEAVHGFTVAGENGIFTDCSAVIDGETVILNCSNIGRPFEVRYGWKGNPECNLYNNANLPASPFRAEVRDSGN